MARVTPPLGGAGALALRSRLTWDARHSCLASPSAPPRKGAAAAWRGRPSQDGLRMVFQGRPGYHGRMQGAGETGSRAHHGRLPRQPASCLAARPAAWVALAWRPREESDTCRPRPRTCIMELMERPELMGRVGLP